MEDDLLAPGASGGQRTRSWIEKIKNSKANPGRSAPAVDTAPTKTKLLWFAKPYWQVFLAVSAQRRYDNNNPQAVTVVDILAASILLGFDENELDLLTSVILALDSKYLSIRREQIRKEADEAARKQRGRT